MTDLERRLLDIIQNDFPVSKQPYVDIGNILDISAEECFEIVKSLKEQGIIRRIGGVFSSKNLGYVGSLCAAKVDDDKIDSFAEVLNNINGVTHNYVRAHEYNIWFTIIAEGQEALLKQFNEIKSLTGVTQMQLLPAIETFKINTNFKMEG